MKETKQEILNRLFVENNLTDEDYFKHKFYTIITRSGIDKIQAINDIQIKYELIFNSPDTKCIIIKATARMGDKVIETFGEAAPNNNQNSYPVAMAEKRAMSRACLKLTGFYENNVFGESEADVFNRNNN
jgi:hypothetical protein|tara:strand:+ start:4551 stop:4940 length:390 start_codon:yes stop_codon:yes gene_type:complete